MTYNRLKVSGIVDIKLAIQFNNDCQYWNEELETIKAVITFLTPRELPLRADNEISDSVKKANYFGIMELISQFHPFLWENTKKYGNAGKDIPSSRFQPTKQVSARTCMDDFSFVQCLI
jgi:hypothetical protein